MRQCATRRVRDTRLPESLPHWRTDMSLRQFEDYLRHSIATHSDVASELHQMYPGCRGFSERSVRRFCAENGITRRSHMTDGEVVDQVHQAVAEVSAVLVLDLVYLRTFV